MKISLSVFLLFFLFSCSKVSTPVNNMSPTDEVQTQLIRLSRAQKILLGDNSKQYLYEVKVLNKLTGQNTYAYIIMNKVASFNAQAPGGGLSTGWILHNDGCFYHGTIITGSSGASLFVEDPNPYTDNQIGNEPKCGYNNVA